MIKLVALAGLVVAAQQPTVTTKLSVQLDGSAVGTAEAATKLLDTGGKQTVLTMNLKMRGMESRVRQESVLDLKGQPVRMILEVVADKTRRQHIAATFDGDGAAVSITLNGKTELKKVPLEQDAPRENPSEFWFLKSQPKVGEKVVYYAFETSNQSWNLKTKTYEGLKEVTVAGKVVKGHVVRGNDDSLSVQDDKGRVIALSQKNLAMLAVPSAAEPVAGP